MSGGFPIGLGLCNGTDIGTDTANSRGTSVVGVSHAYGNYTQIVASTTFDASFIMIALEINATAAIGFGSACKIAVGAAGSEVDILADLFLMHPVSGVNTSRYLFPVDIPAGTRISAAISGDGGADTIWVNAVLFDSSVAVPGGCAGVDSLGMNSGHYQGTSMTAGAANTKGSYAQLTASTPRDYLGLLWSFTTLAVTVPVDKYLLDIAIGAAGSERIIIPNYASSACSSEFNTNHTEQMFAIEIPAGSRLAARIQTVTGSQIYGIVLYGVYQ